MSSTLALVTGGLTGYSDLVTGGMGQGSPVAPTTATLSGPTSGLVGVASAAFTITLNSAATVSESFPITYAGGSVTTSPVVIGIGQTTGTFTVTPSSGGANNVTLGAGTTGLTIAGSPIAYQAWVHNATLTDANGTSLADFVCQLQLTTSNFPFAQAQSTGADLRVYDATAAAFIPVWLFNWNQPAGTCTVFYLATLTSHTHQLWWGCPSASAVSSFASVFTHGTGFDVPGTNSGWGDMTAATAANGIASQLAASAGNTDARQRQIWRRSQTATIPYNENGDASVRDMRIVTDQYGNIVPDGSGNWIAYYGSCPASAARRTFRCQSADQGVTWTAHTLALSPGGSNTYDGGGAMVGTVIKAGPTDYRMWYTATGQGSGIGGVAYATSPDNTAWTKAGIQVPANSSAPIDFTCLSLAVPCVRLMASGTWVMYTEARGSDSTWHILGWTSTDASTWSIMNSGHDEVYQLSGSSWATDGTANPLILELVAGSSYALLCNGHTSVGVDGGGEDANYGFQIGWFHSTAYTGPWAVDTLMPCAGQPAGTNLYGVEEGGLSFDASGNWIACSQVYASNSISASIFRTYPIPYQGGAFITPATTDGALAGVMLSTGSFTAENRSFLTSHRANGAAAALLLGLADQASVPSPGTSTSLGATIYLAVKRTTLCGDGSNLTSVPGAIVAQYVDTGGTTHNFDGSAWQTTNVAAGSSDLARETFARTAYDGTNYILSCNYADTGAAIFTASIAASSVQTFGSGRCLLAGDPYTNAWSGGQFSRQIDVRPYAATEPAMSIPALTVLAYPAAMMMGL